MKFYCKTKQLPALPFYCLHQKPHGDKGFSKNYNLSFNIKLGNDVCANFRILCDYVACTSMLENPVYLIYHKMNKSNINLSPSTIIGHYSGP